MHLVIRIDVAWDWLSWSSHVFESRASTGFPGSSKKP